MNRIGVVGLVGLFAMAGLVACQAAGDDPGEEAPPEEAALNVGPPTLEELENATYQGFEDPASVTLTDGTWTGEPYTEDSASRPEISTRTTRKRRSRSSIWPWEAPASFSTWPWSITATADR